MTTYKFLSDEWIVETRRLREQFLAENPAPGKAPKLRINLVVTEVPFGDGAIDAHLDSSSGQVELELGHLNKVDVTMTVLYDTAKQLFVDGRTSSALEAMQLGRIKVKGNMFKLMGLAKLGNDPTFKALSEKIKEITE